MFKIISIINFIYPVKVKIKKNSRRVRTHDLWIQSKYSLKLGNNYWKEGENVKLCSLSFFLLIRSTLQNGGVQSHLNVLKLFSPFLITALTACSRSSLLVGEDILISSIIRKTKRHFKHYNWLFYDKKLFSCVFCAFFENKKTRSGPLSVIIAATAASLFSVCVTPAKVIVI